MSGTSFATAYVSGIAALLLERESKRLDTADIAKLIMVGADDLGPAGRDEDFGAGRINALKALRSMREVASNLHGSQDVGDRRQPPPDPRRQPAAEPHSELLP